MHQVFSTVEPGLTLWLQPSGDTIVDKSWASHSLDTSPAWMAVSLHLLAVKGNNGSIPSCKFICFLMDSEWEHLIGCVFRGDSCGCGGLACRLFYFLSALGRLDKRVWRDGVELKVRECRGMGEQGLEMLNYSYHHTWPQWMWHCLVGPDLKDSISLYQYLFCMSFSYKFQMLCSICHHHNFTMSVTGFQWIQQKILWNYSVA